MPALSSTKIVLQFFPKSLVFNSFNYETKNLQEGALCSLVMSWNHIVSNEEDVVFVLELAV